MADELATGAAEHQIARLVLAAERDYLAASLAFLREVAQPLGLVADDLVALERAVQEVCLNVIEHGFEPGQPGRFDVVLLRRPGQLVIAVEDQGVPFDWTRLEAGPAPAASSLTVGTDAIRFLSLGMQGNRVEIVKHLPYDHIGSYLAAGTVAPPLRTTELSTEPVAVRAMTAEDAVAVARCTYAVYGYSVPDEYLYVPDRMREMLAGGLLEVCVGATAGGEIVSCLTREVAQAGAPVGYLGEGMVDPRFRGHRLLEQMLRFVESRAAAQGMLGLYGEAVTVHPFSQKSNLALGFTETGIQLADEAPAVQFKQIDNAPEGKRTATVLNFLKTAPSPVRSVYLPAQHQAMIQRIYEHGRFERASRRRLLPRRRAPPSSAWRSFPSGAKPPSASPPTAPTSSTSCVSACAGCASVTSTGSASTSLSAIPRCRRSARNSKRSASSSRGSFPSWWARTCCGCSISTRSRPTSPPCSSLPTSPASSSST